MSTNKDGSHDVLSSFNRINRCLRWLNVCPFTVNSNTNRLHTTAWNSIFTCTVILTYYAILCFAVRSELPQTDLSTYTMVDWLLNVAAVSMASCFPLTAMFGHSSRLSQIELLHTIADLDIAFPHDASAIEAHYRHTLHKFNRSFVGIVIFKPIAWLGTSIVMGNSLTRCIFFACYSLSDAIFTIYINWVCFCGEIVAARFESHSKRLLDCLQCHDGRRQDDFSDCLRELDALHQLKNCLYRAFGSIVLFTDFYHSFALAIAVYGIIIAFDRTQSTWMILATLILYAIWMSMYLVRIVVLGHVYDVFGIQVCVCFCY